MWNCHCRASKMEVNLLSGSSWEILSTGRGKTFPGRHQGQGELGCDGPCPGQAAPVWRLGRRGARDNFCRLPSGCAPLAQGLGDAGGPGTQQRPSSGSGSLCVTPRCFSVGCCLGGSTRCANILTPAPHVPFPLTSDDKTDATTEDLANLIRPGRRLWIPGQYRHGQDRSR